MTQGLRLTESEGRQLLARHPGAVVSKSVAECLDGLENRKAPKPRRKSKGHLAYELELKAELAAGLIRWWADECTSLVIADDGKNRSRYQPDFMVWHLDSSIQLVEIKGFAPGTRHQNMAGRTKFIAARERYPMFKFTMLRYHQGRFEELLPEEV